MFNYKKIMILCVSLMVMFGVFSNVTFVGDKVGGSFEIVEKADAKSKAKATTKAKAKTTTKAKAKKIPTSFKNCTEMRKYYPKGVSKKHPAYHKKHDRDKDGWACEK